MRGISYAMDKDTDIADGVNVYKRVGGCDSWHIASTFIPVSLASTQAQAFTRPWDT